MRNTLRNVLIPVLIGLGLLAIVGVLGSGLVLIRAAADVHLALGWLVAGILGAGLVLVLVVPLVQVARLPGALVRPARTEGPKWDAFVLRYARRLGGNPSVERVGFEGLETLRTSKDPRELESAVEGALAVLEREANVIIARFAATVFTTTAVSQSGRMDTAIVLSAQFRLVREIAALYYQRPNLRELWELYGNVGASAFFAGEIQDSELIAVLGAPVTAGITGFIPVAGTDPLVTLLVSSLMDGSANAFMTLRVGVLSRRYCGIRLTTDKRLVARSASLEATAMLGVVVGQGANRVASATRKLILDGAVRGTGRAAKGLFGKIGNLAERAGTAAVDTTQSGIRFLNESLRFWETVAESEDPAAELKSAAGPSPRRADLGKRVV